MTLVLLVLGVSACSPLPQDKSSDVGEQHTTLAPPTVASRTGSSDFSSSDPSTTKVASPTTEVASPYEPSFVAEFDKFLARKRPRALGVAVMSVGNAENPITLGNWLRGPAWSTSKVPLSLAALRHDHSQRTEQLVLLALTVSDNGAAEQMWSDLGSGNAAATRVDQVLRDYGDMATRTQAERVRAEFTAFGQTVWSLRDQVKFASALACFDEARFVREAMGKVTREQAWGLGRLSGAVFKGGWGPDRSGRYLVRQFGVVTLDHHQVAVALAVESADGSFSDGVSVLNGVAELLQKHLHPSRGSCQE